MSSEPQATTIESTAWPALGPNERRVLGVLVEKAKTTPDVYPLSMNSMVTGSNQKSNRDPVYNLSEDQAEQALLSLQKKGLVARIQGGRVERWRHLIYETWKVDKVEIAILGELLLRGAQTEGELRARASRMEPVGEMDAMRIVLRRLAERRLVVYLTPEGRRGTTLTHGFYAPEDLERLRTKHGSDADEVEEFVSRSDHSDEADRSHRPDSTGRLEEALAQIASLQSMVEELKSKVASLEEDVRTIKQGLGI